VFGSGVAAAFFRRRQNVGDEVRVAESVLAGTDFNKGVKMVPFVARGIPFINFAEFFSETGSIFETFAFEVKNDCASGIS